MKLNYDEISPITQNKSVLVEFDDWNGVTKICMDSGYQYLERLNPNEFELTCPQIIKDSKIVTDDGKVWYKLIIVTPTLVLMPNNEQWKIVGLRKMMVDDDISNSEVTLVNGDEVTVLDTLNEVIFDSFSQAIDNFYKLIK